MFKLESYITPLLMGYLDKYVKLRHEDFQLSLWGGDAVLNNLDLRLDELEKVIQLPVMFQSGHIHELRLHVPWTKLGSEPVVITINTVECILKVRDRAYDVAAHVQSGNSPKRTVQQKIKVKRRTQPTEGLPPGYLQSIVNRIINNVTFIINNLILKFVEDDIVLSVNIKSAECYSVDKEWNRAFVDLLPEDLALRKVLNFADLTVCLDKTNSSGHIESYQEPVAYRCAVTCRLYMEYESTVAKFPKVTRFNLYCETLNLSLTDTQLPMLVRLIELCIAMYYGTLDIPSPTSEAQEATEAVQSQLELTATDRESFDDDDDSEMSEDQGWVSWAWSYVPQILPTEEEAEDLEKQLAERGQRGKLSPHVLSLGFYIHQGTIVFKLTERSRESTELPHRKIHFHPFLKLSGEGLGIEVLLQGLIFCNIQCGFTAFKLSTCGSCICGVADEKVARCNTLLSGGEPLDKKTGLTYITNSLFDDTSWENTGQRSRHILDGEEHRQVHTEQQALQRFGAFWVDSLYTLEKPEKPGAGSNSSETDGSELMFQKEFSTLRFVLGSPHLHISSTLYHRVSKLIDCANNHQYQPYGSSKPSTIQAFEDRPKPTEEQIQLLEDFIPTPLLHLMVINPMVTVLSAEHPDCDVAKKSYRVQVKKRDNKGTEEQHQSAPLAAIVLSATRFDLQITRPMYPVRLVKMVTAVAGPSSNLLHHCHVHTQIKLFSLQAGLQKAYWDGKVSRMLILVTPCSFALYSRSLVLPKLWTNSSLPQKEWMYEIPNVSMNVNKASVLFVGRVLSSWIAPAEKRGGDLVLDDSLLDDLFPVSGESAHHTYPLLELGLNGLEFKSCESGLVNAWIASLSSLHVFLYTPSIGGKMSAVPIFYGPNDTSAITEPDFFTRSMSKTEVRSDCITMTVQIPKHTGVSEAQALALMDCQGICVWLDPSLASWFHYCPQPRPGRKTDHQPFTLDLTLAQMTSPLNAMSNASVHSSSSPSHPGKQPTSMSAPPHQERPASIPEERDEDDQKRKAGMDDNNLGKILAVYFPLIRMLHVQVEFKPSVIFLPKTSIPNLESSSDILGIVHQARHVGRLSDTLVVCLPSITVASTMAKPMSIIQELPVTSIQGSLIGEKLPWTVKITNACAYSLLSVKPDPVFFLHPVDIVSTIAINCKYSPPTSETISTLALCLHVDVSQPKIDISSAQLQLFSIVLGTMSSVGSNAHKLVEECKKLFVPKAGEKLSFNSPAPISQRKSVSSTCKIESVRSADVTENITTDISEDFSHEGSPLHESIIDDCEDFGVKLSLWLQLMIPRLSCTIYEHCRTTDLENGVALSFDHFDLTMDSQNVYSKARMTLGSISIQHSHRSRDGIWSWTDPENIVLSCSKQLPRNLHTVTNKSWNTEHNMQAPFLQSQEMTIKDKAQSVLSVTFTRALCKNVKKRLRKANVDLPSIAEPDPSAFSTETEYSTALRPEDVEFYFHEYLSEVCIKTEPLDIVLKPELISILSSLISGMSRSGRSGASNVVGVRNSESKLSQAKKDVASFEPEPVGVCNLPLIYADLATVRVFVPKLQTLEASAIVNQATAGKFESYSNTKYKESGNVAAESILSTVINIEMDAPLPQNTARPTNPSSTAMASVTPSSSRVHTEQPVSGGAIFQGSSVVALQPDRERDIDLKDSSNLYSKSTSEVCSTLSHNMIVLQVGTCLLQPYADNPLPRVAQEKEVFHYAVQSGFSHQPGSVVEDRQYQIDIKGVSVSTGSWSQIVHELKQEGKRKAPKGSAVQIPALDWNTFLMDSPAQEIKDIRLIPLMAPFDLCLVLAPSITYIPKMGSCYEQDNKAKTVCGFTSEINLTSDLDLFLNFSQVELVSEIMVQLFESCKGDPSLAHASQTPPAPTLVHDIRKGGKSHHQPSDLSAGVDSGVESDLSTLTLDVAHKHAPQQQHSSWLSGQTADLRIAGHVVEGKNAAEKNKDDLQKALSFMSSLDVLVTAGRVSCVVYTHKILDESFVLDSPASQNVQTSSGAPASKIVDAAAFVSAKDNLGHILGGTSCKHSQDGISGLKEAEHLNEGAENEKQFEGFKFTKGVSPEDGLKQVIAHGSPYIVPFVYVYITQPHFLMANHSRDEMKIEVACYDVLIKGASEKHMLIDDSHVIPDSSDYNIHWLETRAGRPHPFTGIPPSLLTARFIKEMTKPDTLSIYLERPLRLRISEVGIKQIAALCSELSQILPTPGKVTVSESESCESRVAEDRGKDSRFELFSLVERVEISSSQIVVTADLANCQSSAGVVLSLEEAVLQADISEGQNSSVTANIQFKDVIASTSYDKRCRQMIGPFTVTLDASLSWIQLPNNKFIPQLLLATEFGLIPLKFGQEHLFCLTELSQGIARLMQDLCEAVKPHPAAETGKLSHKIIHQKVTDDFVQDRSHDDLRCGGFQFIEQPEGPAIHPEPGEIVFSRGGSETDGNSSMTWCYPVPRAITSIHMTPVPFGLSSSAASTESASSEAAVVPCILQHWDELQADFVDVAEFYLSENEPTTVMLPEPRPANASELIVANVWRVMLLQLKQAEGDGAKQEDLAVLPSSLAACMCVDSACIPLLIPLVQLSVTGLSAEIHLCHHLKYNGTELPKKLSLFHPSSGHVEEQEFAVVRVGNGAGAVSHVTGREGKERKTSIKFSLDASFSVLEYGHLTMDQVLAPVKADAKVEFCSKGEKQDISGNVCLDRIRLRVGKSTVQTLNMAVAAWSMFKPDRSGPHIVFSNYILCNNTTSVIRFGQAGTDENIVLGSREMYGYSWRSHNYPQLLHLCMDKPSWKWTEPFPLDTESTFVRHVKARDQSYVVIVKLKQLTSLQMQVTVFGQLVISNCLSQPISMRISHSTISGTKDAKGDNAPEQTSHHIIHPGANLPSMVSNDMLLNPVQFRLAGYTTSWSHDIFLSGDRLKDNQMVKIPLPDNVNYFHIWCRIFCQHFQGMPQKLIMLTPLYVVRMHLPRSVYIHMDSPKVKRSQEIVVAGQGQEFQLHLTGGDVTHHMSFRLSPGMLLSSPAVVLSTGLIGQLPRSQLGSVDIEQICEQKIDVIQEQWPYLMEDTESRIELSSDVSSTKQVSLSNLKDSNIPLSYDPANENEEESQPSIDLNVRLSEYIPGCDTLLVEVSPSFLVHNATDIALVIVGSDEKSWCVKPEHTIAPPLLKESFKLLIKDQNVTSEEKIIPMSGESTDYRRYNGDIGKVLFIDGYVHTAFQIFLREANKVEMLFLTITSNEQHGIRVICIHERFALSNQTGKNLTMKLLALPLNPQQVQMSEMEATIVSSSGKKSDQDIASPVSVASGGQRPQPLFRWLTIQNDSMHGVESDSLENEVTYVYYVSFSLSTDHQMSSKRDWQWSVPVRLVSSKDGHRMTTSIPDYIRTESYGRDNMGASDSGSQECKDQTPGSQAVCVVTQQVKGVTHVVVTADESPVCIIENLCSFSLQFGQACDRLTGNDAVVQEQVELVSDLPWVPPGGWCHYTPPVINSEFVSRDTVNIPKLHFRAVGVQLPDSPSTDASVWSTGIQISGNLDAFVRLPGVCDLKVLILMEGMVTHLIVRPVSKAEITAKEIRSRIMDHAGVKTQMSSGGRKSAKIVPPDVKLESSIDQTSSDSSITTEASKGTLSVLSSDSLSSLSTTQASTEVSSQPPSLSSSKHVIARKHVTTYPRFSDKEKARKHNEPATKTTMTFGILCSSFVLVLQDESNLETVSDLMCIHSEDIFFASYPVFRSPDQLGSESSFSLSIGNIQIDNQQYGVGAYDFPVLFIPQKVKDSADSAVGTQKLTNLSVLELQAVMKLKAFVYVQVVTFSDPVWQQSVIETVAVSVKPFSLYVDDTFVYRLIEEVEAFIPSRLSVVSDNLEVRGTLNRRLPEVVRINSCTLSHPIRVKHLTIQPIKMLLSVHASLKLFLATDHTPLSVSKFERECVYSTFPKIAHALTVHYASAAVFRAGIVVGSLEILGNPTGLVRSIGTGVSDLISLPYLGLTRGPGAFFTGLSMGFGSLVKNVSAGMITSVTNFASSVSRNMDRLSFDSTHLERQEENRRNRPVGVSDGLKQGLTGFGISLLGAVAGLADQPIQTLLAAGSQDKPRSSASSAASDLVTGVGKGLVGVFTKPIGGAAEFVSQTGQGILHGTGLAQLPSRLEKPVTRYRKELSNGSYKYSVKIFSTLPNPDILLVVPAITFDLLGSEVKVELLMTPDVLVVVNSEEDAQQQALALSELDCKRGYSGSGGDHDDAGAVGHGRLVLQWVDQVHGASSTGNNKDRVAAFIDTQTVAGPPAEPLIDQSLSKLQSGSQSESGAPTLNQSDSSLPRACSQLEIRTTVANDSVIFPQYEFKMEPHFQELFLAVFRLAKNRQQGQGFVI